MKTTRLKSDLRCAGCGKEVNATSDLSEQGPKGGELTICFYCGHIQAFTDELKLRELNDKEMYYVAGNRRILAMQKLRAHLLKGEMEGKQESTMTEEFSVIQFFVSGEYEKVREFVGPEEAVTAAKHYCNSVAAKLGIVNKVIITDGGDCINFQWEHGRTGKGRPYAAGRITLGAPEESTEEKPTELKDGNEL